MIRLHAAYSDTFHSFSHPFGFGCHLTEKRIVIKRRVKRPRAMHAHSGIATPLPNNVADRHVLPMSSSFHRLPMLINLPRRKTPQRSGHKLFIKIILVPGGSERQITTTRISFKLLVHFCD